MKIFSPHATGTLVERPNRFIVHVQLPGEVVRAHCPNPGRLIELMNPGREMILEKGKDPARKTAWTMVAANYKGETVALYSSRANTVAGELIIPQLFPDAKNIKAEYKWNNSRFDWHFFVGDREIFLEVKACTLIEEETAMFPDAPSLRASRHLRELAEISETSDKKEGHAVFVIMNPGTRRFIPNLHTDPDFAICVGNVADKVTLHGVSCACDPSGNLSLVSTDIPILTDLYKAAENDSGIYMLLITMKNRDIPIGSMGEVHFKKGYYIYTGSAAKNLKSRVGRHLRKRKKFHWHVDYLLAESEKVRAFPIYTEKDLECSLASNMSEIAEESVEKFGCSDCNCPSHLFYFRENPLYNREFLDLLFHYRHTLAFEESSFS